MSVAHEFGDDDLALAAQRALDEDCGRTEEGGVLRYANMSNLSNIIAVLGRVRRRGDYRRAVQEGPSPQTLQGPMLTGIAYPDVLVARAYSADGKGLDLVLHPGTDKAEQALTLENLTPGQSYTVSGAISETVTASPEGKAQLNIRLTGRTQLTIRPA
jgi:hypothetical protein